MSMPLWATLASLIVACVHPVQNILDNHMQPVKGALASAGSCSIPLTLVVLGAYFYVPPKEASGTDVQKMSTSTSMESLADSFKDLVFFKRKRKTRSRSASLSNEPVFPGETKTVVIAVLSRMIITPLLLMPLMAMSTKFDWHKVLDE
jgi:predicted permease